MYGKERERERERESIYYATSKDQAMIHPNLLTNHLYINVRV
jgi:hypothetical protein